MEEQNEPARNASPSVAGGEKMNEDLSMNSEGEKELSIKDCKKKIKNYTSIIILLVGLLVGSIFVDVAQFFGQQGVSPRVLKSIDVFPLDGKTWVAYNEPVVNVQILTQQMRGLRSDRASQMAQARDSDYACQKSGG